MASQQLIQQQVTSVDAILYKLRCYRDPQRVRLDVLELLRNFPSLQPRSGALVNNTTQQNQIIYLVGTVPIFYNNVQYNIPVNIWIVEAYPFAPPMCYVTPTQDMIIKPKHRHVDSNGVTYLPYLSQWNPTTCNLVNLVSVVSQTFGQDPPVRSQASPSTSSSSYNNVSSTNLKGSNSNPIPQPSNPIPGSGSGYSQQPAYPPAQYQNQQNIGIYPYGNSNGYGSDTSQQSNPIPYQNYSQSGYPNQNGQPFEDPQAVIKRNALRSATEKTQSKLQQFFSGTTREIDTLIAENAKLEDRIAASNQEQDRVKSQQEKSSADISSLNKNFDELTKWLETNDKNAAIDIDAITEPKDSLSKQLLYLVAEDATMEDTLYYLEKNLISGELPLEVFLKTIRSICTEQFIKRATIKKIHERQRSGSLIK